MYPGHNWMLKFGKVVGNMRCVEKEFKLAPHKYEEYKEGCVSISVGRSLNEQDLRENQVPEVSIESIGPKLVFGSPGGEHRVHRLEISHENIR